MYPAWGLIALSRSEHDALLERFNTMVDSFDYTPAVTTSSALQSWSETRKRVAPFPFYFEKQTNAQCGMHALNAYVGWPFLSANGEAWEAYRRIARVDDDAKPDNMMQDAMWRFLGLLYEPQDTQRDNGVAWLSVAGRRRASIGFFKHPLAGVQPASLDSHVTLETCVRTLLALRRAVVWRANHYFTVRLVERTDAAPLERGSPTLYAILDSSTFTTNQCTVVTPRGLVMFFVRLIRTHDLIYLSVELDDDDVSVTNERETRPEFKFKRLFETFQSEIPVISVAPTPTPYDVVQKFWTRARTIIPPSDDDDDDDAQAPLLPSDTGLNALIGQIDTTVRRDRILAALDASLHDCSIDETLPQLTTKMLANALALMRARRWLPAGPRDVTRVLRQLLQFESVQAAADFYGCVGALVTTTPRASVTAALVRDTLTDATSRFAVAEAFATRVLASDLATFRVDATSLLEFARESHAQRLVAALIDAPPRYATRLETERFSVYIRSALHALHHVELSLAVAFYHFDTPHATKFIKHLIKANVSNNTALAAAREWISGANYVMRWRVGALFVALLADHFRWRRALDPRATDMHTARHAPSSNDDDDDYKYVAKMYVRDADSLSDRNAIEALRALGTRVTPPDLSPIPARHNNNGTLGSDDSTLRDESSDGSVSFITHSSDDDDDDRSSSLPLRMPATRNDTFVVHGNASSIDNSDARERNAPARRAAAPAQRRRANDVDVATQERAVAQERATAQRLFRLETLCHYFLRDVYAHSNFEPSRSRDVDERMMALRYDSIQGLWCDVQRGASTTTRGLMRACDFAAGVLWPA